MEKSNAGPKTRMVSVYFPKKLWARLEAAAKRDKRSISQMVVLVVEQYAALVKD